MANKKSTPVLKVSPVAKFVKVGTSVGESKVCGIISTSIFGGGVKQTHLLFDEFVFGSKEHTIKHPSNKPIENYSNFIAAYFAKIHEKLAEKDEYYTEVGVYDLNFAMLSISKINYSAFKEKCTEYKTMVQIDGNVLDLEQIINLSSNTGNNIKIKLSDIIDKNAVDTFIVGNYTKDDALNILLGKCNEPIDYNKSLSLFFHKTKNRIEKLKSRNIDVYINKSTKQLYAIRNTWGIDENSLKNECKSKYIRFINQTYFDLHVNESKLVKL